MVSDDNCKFCVKPCWWKAVVAGLSPAPPPLEAHDILLILIQAKSLCTGIATGDINLARLNTTLHCFRSRHPILPSIITATAIGHSLDDPFGPHDFFRLWAEYLFGNGDLVRMQ